MFWSAIHSPKTKYLTWKDYWPNLAKLIYIQIYGRTIFFGRTKPLKWQGNLAVAIPNKLTNIKYQKCRALHTLPSMHSPSLIVCYIFRFQICFIIYDASKGMAFPLSGQSMLIPHSEPRTSDVERVPKLTLISMFICIYLATIPYYV